MTRAPELRTERLLLRDWREDDLDAWAAIVSDTEVTRWLGAPEGMTREDAWRDMAYHVGHWELRGYGQWVLEELDTGDLAGRAGLYRPEGWPGLEVGWAVDRSRWGRGYAPEAGRAAIAWARDELGASHLVSLIADDNVRSARVAEKLGMTVQGRALLRGQFDVRVYGRDV